MGDGAAPATLALPPAVPSLIAPAHWRAIDFISDLHLASHSPRTFAAWAAYMRQTPADAVYILGDLFDLWVGDDAARRGFEARCAEVLAEAARRISVGFMIGNRDFLVGDVLLGQTGVTRLEDPTLVVAFGRRVLLTHGDALCIDDESYQRYRRFVNRAGAQRAFSWLPLVVRRGIGRALRRTSRGQEKRESPGGSDVDSASVGQWLEAADAVAMIHGHTHAPASHALPAGRVRHVLSDWSLDDAASPRSQVLRWDAAGLHRLRPEGAS